MSPKLRISTSKQTALSADNGGQINQARTNHLTKIQQFNQQPRLLNPLLAKYHQRSNERGAYESLRSNSLKSPQRMHSLSFVRSETAEEGDGENGERVRKEYGEKLNKKKRERESKLSAVQSGVPA